MALDMISPVDPGAVEPDDAVPRRVSWAARAEAIGARPLDAAAGAAALAAVWGTDRHFGRLTQAERDTLAARLEYVDVPARQTVIVQDEQGDYLLVVLSGSLSVERVPASGPSVRLSRAGPGDIIGEMAVLDAGARFSTCTTLRPTQFGMLHADGLDAMIADEPRLAAVLLASMSRRLSLRVRQVSARLSALA